MRWQREGDVWRAIDSHGWTRYLIYCEGSTAPYRVVGPLGTPHAIREYSGTNKRELMRFAVQKSKELGYR